MTYTGDLLFLAKAIEELKNAKILDADMLKAVVQSDEPFAFAKICCILKEVNFFDKAQIIARAKAGNGFAAKKADNALAMKIVREAGALQDNAQKGAHVNAIFSSATPMVEAKRIAQEHKAEQERQARDHLASVRAVVVPPVAPVAVSLAIPGKSAADIQREAAVLAGTQTLAAAGITEPACVSAVTASIGPERMAAAIVRLAELGALSGTNVGALKAQDTVLGGANDLKALAENLALLG